MGSNRQLEPKKGDRAALYAFIKKTNDTEAALLINDKNKIKNYADSVFLPRFLRLARTRFPPTVDIRDLKPCLFFLFLLLGW